MWLANIIVDISHEKVDRPFQYAIPEELFSQLQIGMQVQIPFGQGNTQRTGYVIEITKKAEFPLDRIKYIIGIVDSEAKEEIHLIQLAKWIKEQYGSTMIMALKTALPMRKEVKQKVNKQISLLTDREKAKEEMELFRQKKQVAKVRLIEALLESDTVEATFVANILKISTSTIKSLEKSGMIEVSVQQCYRNPMEVATDAKIEPPKELSQEQQHAVNQVVEDFHQGIRKVYLIHGITGSGKTEVYLSMIENIILSGKQVIMLIPEIALTYQTTLRFQKRFGNRVSIINSTLSKGEKQDQFERAKKGLIDVMIGPRSALFTPFPNLGCIVIDEEHEGSYKSEAMPKYHAREVAIELARLSNASVVLGSATPSLESYYQAKIGEFQLLPLTKRLAGGNLPLVHTVDLREELKQGNRSIFSNKLQELMAERLENKEQIMLFLNRRGYAGFISCRECGHVMKCPHCDISLSEHKSKSTNQSQGRKLVCHYCGYEIPMVKNCPTCGSKYILGFRAGTQQIEEQIYQLFPECKVLRMDGDTTKTKDSYEKILSAFGNQEADILIGTQMIVKGHDYKNVTLVGIIAADLSLAASDYRASERTFQLITQAAGRAGRGDKAGEVVIQTYQPEHYSIVHAANQDYESFYHEEMVYRDWLKYPPGFHILAIQIAAREEMDGKKMAVVLGKGLKKMETRELTVIGPAEANVNKINDIYRYVIYVKSNHKESLITIKDKIEDYLKEVNKKEVIVQFDFNPIHSF
ncbi:MAG: primosomal protein N' [Eubacteriales bacterium]